MKERVVSETKSKMDKTVEAIRHEFATIRTGRASTALLDGLTVDAYGSKMPVNQLATVAIPEPRLIVITPWDKNVFSDIEKAILKSPLGLTPQNDGKVIRLPIPPLTEERRKDLVKVVRKVAEDGRVSARNIRRDTNEELKKGEKAGEITEDDYHRLLEKIQEVTDGHIKKIDELLEIKEQEIMEV